MLSFIPVPIGNLEDITLRALRRLRECEVIFSEVPASTRKLLMLHGISAEGKKIYKYTGFSSHKEIENIINLTRLTDVGIVSEAGTPGVSDPGKDLIKHLWIHQIPFEVLPGATALIPTMVAMPRDTSDIRFIGFLPTKKGRETMLKEILHSPVPVIAYESVHRVEKLIQQCLALGYRGQMIIARELTKQFEQIVAGPIEEVSQQFTDKKIPLKGEFVVGWYGRETKHKQFQTLKTNT